MTITRIDIFNKVNFYLKRENKFFSSTDINTVINRDAFRRIAEDINYPRTSYSTYLTSGQYIVSTPIDFIKVDQNSKLTYQYTSNTVTTGEARELRDIGIQNVLTATPGIPENYFMEDEFGIGLYPPSTSGILVIPYVNRPSALSSDADTNELTERCYMAAVFWTTSDLLSADSDERSAIYMQMYNNEITRLKKQYNEMYEISRDLYPHESYTRPSGWR